MHVFPAFMMKLRGSGGEGEPRLQVYACVGNWLLLGKQLFNFLFFSYLFYFIYFFSYRTINPSVRVFQKIDYHTFLNRVWLRPKPCCYAILLSSIQKVRRVESSRVQVRSGLRPASDPKSYFCRQLHPSRNPRACLRSQSG